MIIYIPHWLEFAYLELFPNKEIFYNSYEPSIIEEDAEYIFVKNMNSNYEIYENHEKIIVILNACINKPNLKVINISLEEITKKLFEKFKMPYDKKILLYCEKNEICPFITILNISLGGNLPTKISKELLPLTSTVSTSKYLQTSLWFYFLNKKSNSLFKNYSNEKCLFLYNYIIELENNFAYVDEDLAHVFLLPILLFSY